MLLIFPANSGQTNLVGWQNKLIFHLRQHGEHYESRISRLAWHGRFGPAAAHAGRERFLHDRTGLLFNIPGNGKALKPSIRERDKILLKWLVAECVCYLKVCHPTVRPLCVDKISFTFLKKY